MALGFVSDICGEEMAIECARQIEYVWNKEENNDLFAI